MAARIINLAQERAKRRPADPFQEMIKAFAAYMALFGWRI